MCILGPPYCGIGATIRIGREILCLPNAGFFLYKSPERENIALFSRNRCTHLPIIGGHHFIPKEAILINKRVTFLLNGHLG